MEESIAGLFFVLFFLFVTALAVAATGFWIWMLIDAVQVPTDQYFKSGTKVTWVLVIALLGALGALVYLLAGRPPKETREWLKAQRAAGAPLTAGGPAPGTPDAAHAVPEQPYGSAPPDRPDQATTQPYGGGQSPPRLDKDARQPGTDGGDQR